MFRDLIFPTGGILPRFMALAILAGASAYADDKPGPYLILDIDGEANGRVIIDLAYETAPNHVEQIMALADDNAYDGVAFHRVIEGFMAQTGDVQFGKKDGYNSSKIGSGGSDRPDIKAEFSNIPFDRGVVGMARAQHRDSANSQFFIMFEDGHFLNGKYTVIGRVSEGMEVVDAIKRGRGENGMVQENPDIMSRVQVE